MKKVELEIVALSHSISQTHSYAVVLGEIDGLRRLPIVIGGFEAQAIAVALERMQPTRPLTHDLFANFMSAFSIELIEVLIYRLDEGVFYAKLVCRNNDELVEIDSRTSDALAMAVRASCKIYTYENILDTAGMFLENDGTDSDSIGASSQKIPVGNSKSSSSDVDMRKMSLEELNLLLQTVLEQEDYVRAINIRDEINRRSEK